MGHRFIHSYRRKKAGHGAMCVDRETCLALRCGLKTPSFHPLLSVFHRDTGPADSALGRKSLAADACQAAMQAKSDVTALLLRVSEGDREALDELVPLLYEELRRVAHRRLRDERTDHTYSTTDLVHEAYLKLVRVDQVDFRGRGHFLSMASRAMRRILVDHARRRQAEKRGGGRDKVEFQEAHHPADAYFERLPELDEALTNLEAVSPRACRVVEHRLFGGLNQHESAEALGVSVRTVKRDLRFARAWLASELSPEAREAGFGAPVGA